MFPNAAGYEIVKIQLLEGLTDGIGTLSRRTGRLEKERPAGELGPGRLEEGEIHRLGETHTHGAREAHVSRVHGIFHEDGDAIDEEGLGEAVHYRAKHGIEAHFVGERAAELDEGAAIIKAVAIEEAVEARLDPFAER